ncbi:MAG TPA: BrnT family toxin [Stellaceae bacterium]|nr:BrnT family toxin [Stellaceae bacterium]
MGIFLGHVLETEDLRRDYGERRFRTFGEIDGQVFHVVSTWRLDRRRIISARRARRNERRAYYASIAEPCQEDERPD